MNINNVSEISSNHTEKHICQWYLKKEFDLQNIKRTHTTPPKKTNNPIKKWAKDMNRHLSKKDIQRAHRHIEKMLNITSHQKMQIKTTMKYHLAPAIINKSTNNKCWQGCGENGTLVHCWWEWRQVQPLWKTVRNFLRKLKMELPVKLAIPLLELYPKNSETPIQKNLCTPMFIEAQFTIAKCWKQPTCPSVNEWFKKLWYIYTMEHYAAERKKGILPFETAWMELQSIMLSKWVRWWKTNTIWSHL